MAKFPAQIDDSISLPPATDTLTPVSSDIFNKLRNAILAVESELGVKPSGVYSTVRTRLDTLETVVGNIHSVEIQQDLGGTPENPLVIGFQGRPVSSAVPSVNEIMTWNGIAWVPSPPKNAVDITLAGDLSGTQLSQTVIGLHGTPLSGTVPTLGNLLTFNGTQWAPAAPTPSIDKGAIHPRAASTIGIGGGTGGLAGTLPGAIYFAQAAGLADLLFDPITFTEGVGAAQFTNGPFVWGLTGAQIFRFNTSQNLVTFISMNDVTEKVFESGFGIAQDTNGNIWTIEPTSNTLLQISQNPPVIVNTFPIPNSPKSQLVYDPVHNALILADVLGFNSTICRFTLSNNQFSPDATVISNPNEGVQLLELAGGFLFVGTSDFSGFTNSTWVYKVDPVSLAIIGSPAHITFTSEILPSAFAFFANAGTPKLFVTVFGSTPANIYRIDVGTMTVDTTFAVTGANSVTSMAFNPADSSLWLTDDGISPGTVYQLTNVTASITLANTFIIDAATTASSTGIVFDTTISQFWVSCNGIDSLSSVQTTGTPSNRFTFASNLATLNPGTNGQVLTLVGGNPQWSTSPAPSLPATLPGFMVFTAGVNSTGSTSPTRCGAKFVDLTEFPATVGAFSRTVTFFADIEGAAPGSTAHVQLYNVTDAEVVTGTQLTTSNLTNTEVSTTVTVGLSSGDLKTGKYYEVDFWVTSVGPGIAICTNARLRFSYS